LEAEIGLRGIVGSEGTFRDEKCVLGNGIDLIAGDEVRRFIRADGDGRDLLCLGVVNGPVADEEPGGAINPDIAFGNDVVRLGIVGRGIGVDIGVARMDGDVAGSPRDPAVVVCAAGGGDFDRLLFRANLFRAGQRRGANQT
jgi:hypothetical protein